MASLKVPSNVPLPEEDDEQLARLLQSMPMRVLLLKNKRMKNYNPFIIFLSSQEDQDNFGCCNKPPLIVAVDEPSKGLRIQGRLVKKPSVSDNFWSTSTCEMDTAQCRHIEACLLSASPTTTENLVTSLVVLPSEEKSFPSIWCL